MSSVSRTYPPQVEEIRRAFDAILCGYASGEFGASGLESRLSAIEASILALQNEKIDECKSNALSIAL